MIFEEVIDLEPGVYLIATPIGNLGDITIRALETLRSVDRIACEDTRHTGRLLARFEISKPLLSLHAHNEAQRTAELIVRVHKDREKIAYVSDAGTPGISDPGERLVHRCIECGIHYDIIPGPCAVTTALVGAGLGATPFHFGGFLPTKKGQRTTQLTAALERDCTTIFYESPHRIVSTLQLLADLDGERLCCVARELTKRFQDYHRATAQALFDHYRDSPPKGEICLIIGASKLPRWLKSV